MEIINLTPHDVTVVMDGRNRVLPRSGQVARVSVKRQFNGNVGNIPTFLEEYGEVEGLPEGFPEKIYVVSAMVRLAVAPRNDVFSPGELVRDAAGQPVGCRGLVANA